MKKFKFENATIMEDKQFKQRERFWAMALESDYFLLSDDKSKQIYKMECNNIQESDPYQINNEEISGDISNFYQWNSLFN